MATTVMGAKQNARSWPENEPATREGAVRDE
jgi:hypothetical protein